MFKNGVIALVVAAGVALLVVGLNVPAPTPALNQWTEWVGKVVGILMAARVLWAGATFLEGRAGPPARGTRTAG